MKVLIERLPDYHGCQTYNVCVVDEQKNGRILGTLTVNWDVKPEAVEEMFGLLRAGLIRIE
jgi:hypothetical protein